MRIRKKITITLGAGEKRLLENILTSPWVQLETTEEAVVWSLGVANLFLEEYAKMKGPVSIPGKRKGTMDLGLTPELTPSPMVNPFDILGIDPDLAPGLTPEIAPSPAEDASRGIEGSGAQD